MTRWGHVAIAVLGGIAAALHVGKVPPAIPMLRSELGMDLVAAGWLMGLVSALGAVCGLLIGRFTDHLTHRRAMILGLALLIAGSLIGAATHSEAVIFASRVLESVGLIMVSVAAPGLIASSIDPRDTGLAFALWGVWMPVGVSVMMMISPFLLPSFGWQGSWVFAAMLSLIPMIALMTMKTAQPRAAGQVPTSLPAAVRLTASRPMSWILSGIFATYSASFMAVFGFLPTLLIEDMGIGLAAASVMTALAVLANGIGNVLGGRLRPMGRAALGIDRRPLRHADDDGLHRLRPCLSAVDEVWRVSALRRFRWRAAGDDHGFSACLCPAPRPRRHIQWIRHAGVQYRPGIRSDAARFDRRGIRLAGGTLLHLRHNDARLRTRSVPAPDRAPHCGGSTRSRLRRRSPLPGNFFRNGRIWWVM